MQLLGALIFFISIFFIGLMPFPLLFAFASFIRFIIYRVIGYRKKVVIQNLRGSFPEMNHKELNRVMRLFYKNLTDVFLEGIKAFMMTRGQILKRHKITNPEVLEQLYQTGRSAIGVTGHYCNWEWGSLSASLQTKYNTVAFYKPLNNGYIDSFVRWSRSRFGTTLASIKETTKTFEDYKDTKTVFMMAADQGMPHKFKDKAYWVHFLNRDTAFLHGLEKHAKINNLPVVYVDIQRVKRGYYEIELSIITLNPLELADGVLTEMYARKLESIILKRPENWLWSHRRWKITR